MPVVLRDQPVAFWKRHLGVTTFNSRELGLFVFVGMRQAVAQVEVAFNLLWPNVAAQDFQIVVVVILRNSAEYQIHVSRGHLHFKLHHQP